MNLTRVSTWMGATHVFHLMPRQIDPLLFAWRADHSVHPNGYETFETDERHGELRSYPILHEQLLHNFSGYIGKAKISAHMTIS